MGKGCMTAVKNINEIIGPALIGKDPREQKALDQFMCKELDGTDNKEVGGERHLGGLHGVGQGWRRRVFLCTSTSLSWRVTASWSCRCRRSTSSTAVPTPETKLAMQNYDLAGWLEVVRGSHANGFGSLPQLKIGH